MNFGKNTFVGLITGRRVMKTKDGREFKQYLVEVGPFEMVAFVGKVEYPSGTKVTVREGEKGLEVWKL